MVGVTPIVSVLIIVLDQHQSLSYVFTETVNASGYGNGTTSWSNPAMWSVLGPTLMAQYTITGFDASAHTAEETKAASRMAATGSGPRSSRRPSSGGFCSSRSRSRSRARRVRSRTSDRRPVDLGRVDEPELGRGAALHLCGGAVLLRTASVTSASRMMFAFSRDGAVPGHQIWRRVARNRVPRWSVVGMASSRPC